MKEDKHSVWLVGIPSQEAEGPTMKVVPVALK